MFIDLQKDFSDKVLTTDIAIIGGGVAGITIARELSNSAIGVCLLESGGLDPELATQNLYDGESTGQPYSLLASRLRYFGGSSNHWGGYCRPLQPWDFEKRDWVPNSGWPITRRDLEPFYRRSWPILQLQPFESEDLDYWTTPEESKDFRLPLGRLVPRVIQFSPPTRFGRMYRDELRNSSGVRVVFHANVTEIKLKPGGTAVQHLVVKTLTGKTITVRAKLYVLAAGGLENSRLLLASRSVNKKGVGNDRDIVGRYFMDHPTTGGFCKILVSTGARFPKYLRRRVNQSGARYQANLRPSEKYLASERSLDVSMGLKVGDVTVPRHQAPEQNDALFRAVRGFLEPRLAPGADFIGAEVSVGAALEVTQKADSRIMLSDTLDPLGMPKIRLNLILSHHDLEVFQRNLRSLALELGAMAAGRLALSASWKDREWPRNVSWGNHHIGGTRMSDDPSSGVVDRHCRVHGVANLFVSGSSVFPTCGASNPTMTIVALALRLSDYLKEQCRR